ncbi:MAG: glycosyltransferase [Armatimonadetes bacterium]|nr:glycosyltransferase [Armatimonadota bacterium]
MKIAYLFETFPSPTETFLAREVEALRKLGWEIEIWAMQAGDGAHAIPSPSRALKLAGRQKFLAAQAALLAPQLRAQNISHLHAAWANHIADLAHLAAQKAERSWSFAAHARDLWVEGGDLELKLASAKFGAVCTRAGEEELRKYGENVVYAPHGLPLDKFPFQPWQKERRLRVLGVGRLVEKKGWMDLVAAVGIAQRYGTAVSAQIIGEGPLRGLLERQIAGQGLGASIQLRGALPEDEVVAAMQEANCFVLPSRRASDGDRDGLPNVLLEAAALGLPLVTSDSEGARDFVDEDTAWLFPSSDAMALATALGNVVSRPEKTVELCRAARERVENQFDVEKNVEILARAFGVRS